MVSSAVASTIDDRIRALQRMIEAAIRISEMIPCDTCRNLALQMFIGALQSQIEAELGDGTD